MGINCHFDPFVSTGADIVGINCHFDPFVSLDGMRLMKSALDEAGLKPYLMVQPLAFMTPDAQRQGFIDLPEFPFGECVVNLWSEKDDTLLKVY